ncbi:MAG TPA: hypothetical protein VLK36_05550 [Gaiellaceae bacterium]|nr:hypothetical protein [Gaiellaceae bacterium]
MNALLSFASALVALRLGGQLARRRRYAWAGGLFSFAAATAAMAWGSAHGWDARTFRVYYLAGALLSAPLLGVGSLQLASRRWAAPVGLVYTGLAVGIALAMPVHGAFGNDVPRAQDHVDAVPRVVAIVGSSLGAAAVLIVAAATLRTRPRQGALIVAAVAAAAAASALTQTAVAAAAACFAAAALLLYAAVAWPTRRST